LKRADEEDGGECDARGPRGEAERVADELERDRVRKRRESRAVFSEEDEYERACDGAGECEQPTERAKTGSHGADGAAVACADTVRLVTPTMRSSTVGTLLVT
jgi:hypothetical protein